MKDTIVVYWRYGCSYCQMATRLLDKYGIKYELLELDRDFSREEFYKAIPGAKTFPQILINGTSIGGYEELQESLPKILEK